MLQNLIARGMSASPQRHNHSPNKIRKQEPLVSTASKINSFILHVIYAITNLLHLHRLGVFRIGHNRRHQKMHHLPRVQNYNSSVKNRVCHQLEQIATWKVIVEVSYNKMPSNCHLLRATDRSFLTITVAPSRTENELSTISLQRLLHQFPAPGARTQRCKLIRACLSPFLIHLSKATKSVHFLSLPVVSLESSFSRPFVHDRQVKFAPITQALSSHDLLTGTNRQQVKHRIPFLAPSAYKCVESRVHKMSSVVDHV